MGFHTFDVDRADRLEETSRYRFLSREELLSKLAIDDQELVIDLGSGTGFYSDDVAPYVQTLLALDLQQPMHDYYQSKGVPETVELLTGEIQSLPVSTNSVDAAYSTMTYHEFASESAIGELNRILKPEGRLVLVDWASDGEGASGPPVEERFSAKEAVEAVQNGGFSIETLDVRKETFLLVCSVSPTS